MRPPLTPSQRRKIRAAYESAVQRARARGSAKQLSYIFQACLVFPLVWIVQALPVDRASALGAWLGKRLLAPLMPLHRAKPNVGVAFPELSDEQVDTLLVKMCGNLGRVIAELAHLKAFSGGPDHPRLRISGLDNLRAAQAKNSGVLVLGGHFANWEMLEIALRNADVDGAKVLYHPDNPYVLSWLAKQRYRYGLADQFAQGTGVVAQVTQALKDGRTVQMLNDLYLKKGPSVGFFGHETGTNPLPVDLALELNSSIVLASVRRKEGARYEVCFSPALEIPDAADADEARLIMLEQINSFYEAELRAEPAYWLWTNARWPDITNK